MRWIPTSVHAALDYLGGILLLASPWLFDFADVRGAAVGVPTVIGMAMLLMAAMTAYEFGLVGFISVPAHLTMDAIIGVVLAASPWLFGFADAVWVPHFVLGICEIGAAAMTQTAPTRTPDSALRPRART